MCEKEDGPDVSIAGQKPKDYLRFFCEILQNVTGTPVDVDASFIDNGGHSLAALRLQALMADNGLDIKLRDILGRMSVAAVIANASEIFNEQQTEATIPGDLYSTTSQERSLAMLADLGLNPFDPHYILVNISIVPSGVPITVITENLSRMVEDHPPLNSYLENDDYGVLVRTELTNRQFSQEIVTDKRLDQRLTDADLREIAAPHIRKLLDRGIELSDKPPISAIFISGKHSTLIVLAVHHSVTDAEGMMHFVNELEIRISEESGDRQDRRNKILEAYAMVHREGGGRAGLPEAIDFWGKKVNGLDFPDYPEYSGRQKRERSTITSFNLPVLIHNIEQLSRSVTVSSVWSAVLATAVNYEILSHPNQKLIIPVLSSIKPFHRGVRPLGYSLDIIPLIVDFSTSSSLLSVAQSIMEQTEAWLSGYRASLADLSSNFAEIGSLFSNRMFPLILYQVLNRQTVDSRGSIQQLDVTPIADRFNPYLPLDALVSLHPSGEQTVLSVAAPNSAFGSLWPEQLSFAINKLVMRVNDAPDGLLTEISDLVRKNVISSGESN